METNSNKAPTREERLDGMRFYIFCAFLLAACCFSLYMEKENPPPSRTTIYGFDNERPAPWRDCENIKEIKEHYGIE